MTKKELKVELNAKFWERHPQLEGLGMSLSKIRNLKHEVRRCVEEERVGQRAEGERERRQSEEKMDPALQVCGFLLSNQYLTASLPSFLPSFLRSFVRCFFPCFLRQVLDCWTELNLDVSTLALAVVYVVVMRDADERDVDERKRSREMRRERGKSREKRSKTYTDTPPIQSHTLSAILNTL